MEIISPVSQLVSVIEQVRKSAGQYQGKLSNNEAMTRAVLIDPIIRALGWDTGCPDMVEFECNHQGTKLDYALRDAQAKVSTIIEAKALGANLNDDKIFNTIMVYAFTHETLNLLLTDGLIWKHYNVAGPGKHESVTKDLTKDPLVDCALYFIQHFDAAKFWLGQTPALASTVPVAPPVTLPVFTPPPASIPSSSSPDDFQSLTTLPKDITGNPPPQSFRLPDGNIVPVKYWSHILNEACRFVLKNNPGLTIPLKDKAGLTTTLISETKPTTKKTYFTETTYNGKTVYVNLNYSAAGCIANALYIFKMLPAEKVKVAPAVKI